jgi:hypothetical protein
MGINMTVTMTNLDRSAPRWTVRRVISGASGILICAALLFASPVRAAESVDLDYEAMAHVAVDALALSPGERVMLRFDPGYFEELTPLVRQLIRQSGAVDLAALEYMPFSILGETGNSEAEEAAYKKLLESVDIYVWLPVREQLRATTAAERRALAAWLDEGGTHRQIHFHWAKGSVMADGLAGEHSVALDRMYAEALDVDHRAITEAQDQAIRDLRSGVVRVRTPAGTDIRFRVGDRPFNKQDGDASARRMESARIRIDREIELPSGVLRVAPLEETVQGVLVIPEARMQGEIVKNIRLVISDGRVTSVTADEHVEAVEAELASGGDSARQFREFCLGFHPGLLWHPGDQIIPYFGYGAGVVRMSLGDNEELGGAVRGGYSRWLFFPDATVEVGDKLLVRDGRLL